MSKIPKHSGIDLRAVAKAIEDSRASLEAVSAAHTKMLRTDFEAVARATEQGRANLEAMSTSYAKMLHADLETVAGAFEQSRINLEAVSAAYTKIPRIDLAAVGKALEHTRIRLEPVSAAYAEIHRIDLDAVGRSFTKSFGIDPDAMRTALDRIRIDLGREPFGKEFGVDLDAMRTAFDKNFGIDFEALRQSVAAAHGRHPSDLKPPREGPVHDSGATGVEELDAGSPSPSTLPDQAQDAQWATMRRIKVAWQYLGTLSLIDDLLLGGTAKSALRDFLRQNVTTILVEFLLVLSLLAQVPGSSPTPTGQGPEAQGEFEHIAEKVVSGRDVIRETSIPPREKDR